jgi:hypothetical protein
MRVAKTIELDEQTERQLRVLSKRRRIEAPLATKGAGDLAGGQG